MRANKLDEYDFRLDDRTVHVWAVPIQASEYTAAQFQSVLSPEELTRARNFHFDRLQQSFIQTRASLRILLGRYLERAPEEIAFRYSATGKPNVDMETSLRFNTSHSGDIALFAFARGCELGVDVEQIRPFPEMDSLMRHFFCEEEISQFTSIAPENRENAFFQCLTRKEAYLKATGAGLLAPLNSFCVTLGPADQAKMIHIQGDRTAAERWTLHELAVSPQYAATLAYRDTLRPLKLITIQDKFR